MAKKGNRIDDKQLCHLYNSKRQSFKTENKDEHDGFDDFCEENDLVEEFITPKRKTIKKPNLGDFQD